MSSETGGVGGGPLAVVEAESHSRGMGDEPTRRDELYAELEALPPNVVGEIVGGVLYASPRPASPHARAAFRLGSDVGGPFDRGRGGPGGWVILFEPELHLGQDVLVPDLAGWRRARMPRMPRTAAFTLAPDWVCEVISPSTASLDRTRKMAAYAREGVGCLWLVDPLRRSLEVYRLEHDHWTPPRSHGDEARVRAEPFEALELDLSALWED